MTLKFCTDPTFWNAIANDPSVRPTIGGKTPWYEPVNLFPALAHPGVFGLANEYGGFIFSPIAGEAISGLDVHAMFLQPGRGRLAIEAGLEALALIFVVTDYDFVMTTSPAISPGSYWLARRLGMEKLDPANQPVGAIRTMISRTRWAALWESTLPPADARMHA